MADPKTYTRDQVVSIVNGIMVEDFEAEEAALRPESILRDDLELDSLDGVDLVVAIEKAFSCRIGEEQARKIQTLGDIYEQVMLGLGQIGQVREAV